MTEPSMELVENFGLLAAKCDVLSADPNAPEWEQREFARLADGYRDAQLGELKKMASAQAVYPFANVLGEGPNTSRLPSGHHFWHQVWQAVYEGGIAAFIFAVIFLALKLLFGGF